MCWYDTQRSDRVIGSVYNDVNNNVPVPRVLLTIVFESAPALNADIVDGIGFVLLS